LGTEHADIRLSGSVLAAGVFNMYISW
jgi:hypothetical protein